MIEGIDEEDARAYKLSSNRQRDCISFVAIMVLLGMCGE